LETTFLIHSKHSFSCVYIKLSPLPTVRIYECLMIIRINIDYFPLRKCHVLGACTLTSHGGGLGLMMAFLVDERELERWASLLIINPPSLHAHLSPPPEVRTRHGITTSVFMLTASLVTLHLATYRIKVNQPCNRPWRPIGL
jgi:hypothetical protein